MVRQFMMKTVLHNGRLSSKPVRLYVLHGLDERFLSDYLFRRYSLDRQCLHAQPFDNTLTCY